MPAGRKSKGQHKPSQRQRRQRQSRLGQGVQAYAVQAYADDVHHDHRRLAVKRSVKLVKEAVKRAVKLDDEALCKAMELDEDPKLEDEATCKAPGKAMTLEEHLKLDDESQLGMNIFNKWSMICDHDMICDRDELSHNMATLLRHAAYNEQLLDDDGWLPLSTALRRLRCTMATVFNAVDRSDRHDGLGARFEMYISGSRVWI